MDYTTFETALVPVIVGICAIVGLCIKKAVRNDRVHDFIPTIVCLLGAALAVASMGPSLNALLSGMASGLASTGTWEMVTHWADRSGRCEE